MFIFFHEVSLPQSVLHEVGFASGPHETKSHEVGIGPPYFLGLTATFSSVNLY